MTYLEKMTKAANDFERSKVVEAYTEEFAALIEAAGLSPVVGVVPTANGQVWVPYNNLPAADRIEIIAAIAQADEELGSRAAALNKDVLDCANYSAVLEGESEPRKPPTAAEVSKALEPDPDADSYVWLCPDPVDDGLLEALAKRITPLEQLHKGKIDHICTMAVVDREGELHPERDLVVTLIHRNEEDEIVAVTGYNVQALKEFRKTRVNLEPAPIEEVAEREYNPKLGYFNHARVKLSRKVYVLTRYVSYGDASYLEENHPAWQTEDEPEQEIEPTTSSIELDEEREEDFAAVDEKVGEHVSLAGGRDELERLCSQLFAVKEDKKQTDKEFNEQIKALEDEIRGTLARRSRDRLQHRLPLEDGVPDEEAEKALDAAAEESQEEPSDGPETAPDEDPPTSPDDSEPEEEAPASEPEGFSAPEPDPPAHDFPQCEACDGFGKTTAGDPCEACGGEGIEPAVRESDDDGMLLCAMCRQPRSFWAFLKYEDGRKGHVCNVCRKV